MAFDTTPRQIDSNNDLLKKIAYQLVLSAGSAGEEDTTSLVLIDEDDGVTPAIKLNFISGHFYVEDLALGETFIDFDRASGQLNLGFAGSRLVFNADDVLPTTTATTNFGSALKKYLGAFFSGTVSANSFTAGTSVVIAGVAAQVVDVHSTLTYAASTAIDFAGDPLKTVSLTGDITFTTSNKAAAKSVTIRIISDGSIRTFTFPAWVFVGAAAPASIAASKTAILTLTAYGTNDTDIVAAYAVQP